MEYVRSIHSPTLPLGELNLKVGCPIILLRNLAPSQGLCNGTRMTVCKMLERILEVILLGGDHKGQTALIPQITLTPTDTSQVRFKFKQRQFPVRLVFAMTINKA
jgi:hypothetical protein